MVEQTVSLEDARVLAEGCALVKEALIRFGSLVGFPIEQGHAYDLFLSEDEPRSTGEKRWEIGRICKQLALLLEVCIPLDEIAGETDERTC